MPSSPPTFSAARRLSRAPAAGATVKGFYLRALVRELASNGHHLTTHQSYREFSDYPVAAAHELLNECAERLYPQERKHEALRRVGWIIYPTLLSTMVGRVIFGSLGNDFPAVLRVASRGFEVSLSQGRYEAVHVGSNEARVQVRDFPLFPESFLVGVFEGALAHYGFVEGKVEVRVLSSMDVDLQLSW
jgi:uncharacterized protein (TIGR02265 family)